MLVCIVDLIDRMQRIDLNCDTVTIFEEWLDKDRIKGSAEQAKGKLKEVAGKMTGDVKLESEGKADKAAGKICNAVGGIKDALRGK